MPGGTKHLSNPTLQLFFHKYCQFMSMLCMLLRGSPFFCLAELTNMLENIVYHTAYIFLGNAFIALEDSPTFAVLLSLHKRERSLPDKIMLNNSCPIPICWRSCAGCINFQRKSNLTLKNRHTTCNPVPLHVCSFCTYYQKNKELQLWSNPKCFALTPALLYASSFH